jgi:catechol 2,3-dioxygenase-like lactoylglutathione lyase family enzyme
LQEESGLRIGSVVIDCINFEKMLAFWQEALHYLPREPAKDGWVVLRDPARRNTNVSLNQVQPSEKLTGRNWLHFDLYTRDQEGEVERLLKLGATRHPQEYEPDDDFIVLEDPDGNLFCVVDTTK